MSVSVSDGPPPGAVLHRRWAAGLLVLVGIVGATLAALDATTGGVGAVRAATAVVFLLLGPGWAVAGFLRGGSAALSWTVAVAVSAAVGALGAEAMLLSGRWHPVAALGVLVLLCLPALLRHAVVAR